MRWTLVFNAIIANKILYALPVYYGYLTQDHREMLQRILKRANRRDFTVREYDLEALAENAQYDLFHNSCSRDHCLNHLYTANRKPAGSMQLRHRGNSVSPCLQYTSNLIKDTLSLVYLLTMLDVCHVFVL